MGAFVDLIHSKLVLRHSPGNDSGAERTVLSLETFLSLTFKSTGSEVGIFPAVAASMKDTSTGTLPLLAAMG